MCSNNLLEPARSLLETAPDIFGPAPDIDLPGSEHTQNRSGHLRTRSQPIRACFEHHTAGAQNVLEPVPSGLEHVLNVFGTAERWFAEAQSAFVDFHAPRLPEKYLPRRLFPARPAGETYFQLRTRIIIGTGIAGQAFHHPWRR
jgi:hypothetical protein